MNDTKKHRKASGISIALKDENQKKDEAKEKRPSIVKIKIENSIHLVTNKNTNIVINNNTAGESKFSSQRKDAYGSPIIKGMNKQQRVTFKDMLAKARLVEVINVAKITYEDDEGVKTDNDNVSCTCLVY